MATTTARHHHYLSQAYLKGFTDGRSKKSKLTVIDAVEKKSYATIPRNVGGERDFNRIDAGGVDPDALEKDLSKFESVAAASMKHIERTGSFEGAHRSAVLNLMALLAVRSPQRREHMRKFHAVMADRMMDLSLATKERWESQMEAMRRDGHQVESGPTYEEMKDFHDRKQYRIDVAREWHIHMEFVGFEAILPALHHRKWILVSRDAAAGPFITSDSPVALFWKDENAVPPFYRHNPGFGLKDTIVYFPISQDLSLFGEFDGQDGARTVGADGVANMNTIVLHRAHRFLYAPKLNFPLIGISGEIIDGRRVLSHLEALAKRA